MKKNQSDFISQKTRCSGVLLLPHEDNPPVIVMAHGFGMVKEAGLFTFAERFVAEGYAVFLFDYRGFGESDGSRQWISPRRHLQDWKAALVHVRSLTGVDTSRIVLWGVSFSGGHVIQTAANDPAIRAVIAEVPHVSGLASLKMAPVKNIALLGTAGLFDLFGGLLGHSVYRPIIGQPDEVAALTSPGTWSNYLDLLPENAKWENKTRAQLFLELPLYSPIRHAHKVKVPTLVIAGKNDSITPAYAAKAAVRRMPKGQFILLDSDHFQLNVGELFEQNITFQISFLREVIPI